MLATEERPAVRSEHESLLSHLLQHLDACERVGTPSRSSRASALAARLRSLLHRFWPEDLRLSIDRLRAEYESLQQRAMGDTADDERVHVQGGRPDPTYSQAARCVEMDAVNEHLADIFREFHLELPAWYSLEQIRVTCVVCRDDRLQHLENLLDLGYSFRTVVQKSEETGARLSVEAIRRHAGHRDRAAALEGVVVKEALRCRVCQSAHVDEVDRKLMEEWWTERAVEDWLAERGEQISDSTIRRHKKHARGRVE